MQDAKAAVDERSAPCAAIEDPLLLHAELRRELLAAKARCGAVQSELRRRDDELVLLREVIKQRHIEQVEETTHDMDLVCHRSSARPSSQEVVPTSGPPFACTEWGGSGLPAEETEP